MEKKAGKEYSDLQQGIDQLIGEFGMPKTIQIIKQLSGSTKVKKQKKQWAKLIMTFVISEAFKTFEVEDTEPKNKLSKQYKEARMASYYILKQYTRLSYNQIGEYFGQQKYGVYYHITKCKEVLSIPQFHKSFVGQFQTLEERVIQFIAKIN